MRASALGARGVAHRRTLRTVGLGAAVLVLVGAFQANTVSAFVAFVLVVLAALLPTLLWLRRGGLGIPVLAAYAGMHLLTFALPIVSNREDLAGYSGVDLLRAGGTVALFLLAACLVGEWFAGRPLRQHETERRSFSSRQMITFMFLGLALGLAYQLAFTEGLIWKLGTAVGVARAVSLTAFTAAAYFLGVARASGYLRGRTFLVALGCLLAVILLNASSLYLVGVVTFAGATFLGYVLASRRIPWATLAVFFVLLSVLQNGKSTMRGKYWDKLSGYSQGVTTFEVPGRMIEWFEAGLRDSGEEAESPSVLNRASLLQMLFLAQRLTPAYIDYLGGESYAQVPAMLVPRFLWGSKLTSQAGMDLLNRRYGLISFEGPAESAISWGLIAEGWANFGYAGVLGVGAVVGLLCGILARWTAGAAAVSRPTLLSIAAMLALINASDAASVIVSLWQTFVAILVAFWVFRQMVSRGRGAEKPKGLTTMRFHPKT